MQECSHHFEHTFEPQALSLQASRIICELPPVWLQASETTGKFDSVENTYFSALPLEKKDGILSW